MSKGRQRVELVRGDPWTAAVEVLDDEAEPSTITDGFNVLDKLQFVIGVDLNGVASCYLVVWAMLTPDPSEDPGGLGPRWFIVHFGRFTIEDSEGYPSWVETIDCAGADRVWPQLISIAGAPLAPGSGVYKYYRIY